MVEVEGRVESSRIARNPKVPFRPIVAIGVNKRRDEVEHQKAE